MLDLGAGALSSVARKHRRSSLHGRTSTTPTPPPTEALHQASTLAGLEDPKEGDSNDAFKKETGAQECRRRR